MLTKRDEPLHDGKIYRVLVNSFMYAGGDGYDMIADADPDGFDTGINYRQPFQDWLKSRASSVDNPILIHPQGDRQPRKEQQTEWREIGKLGNRPQPNKRL